ncbi:DUF397 domain-containing protein [Streptomyces sp. NPDC049879]|uniref:DUF397 domain-containing protein n=1 Tax=Streptomyces sp. NPDC049879 TaxID=3365598 RepID=UPI003789BF89
MNQPSTRTVHDWTSSSYCSSTGGTCIEWSPSTAAQGTVPVRDSKAPEGPTLVVTGGAWRSFVGAVRDSELAD